MNFEVKHTYLSNSPPGSAVPRGTAEWFVIPSNDAQSTPSAVPIGESTNEGTSLNVAEVARNLLRQDIQVRLARPAPDERTCEQWRMKTEVNLCAHSATRDLVRTWWCRIYLTKNEDELDNPNGLPQLDAKLKIEVMDLISQTNKDLRREIAMEDIRRHRNDQILLTGQRILRRFYNSIQGSNTMQTIWKMNNYLKVVMRSNDLVAFDADWDTAVETLDSTELKGMVENNEMLKIRYFEQVKNHLLMEHHIAEWERLDDEEKTYAWLRKTVKKVIKERALKRNNKCWQSGDRDQREVRVDMRAGGRPSAKRTKGACNDWLQKGRCSLTNCPYDHTGPPASQRSGHTSRQSSQHNNRPSRGRSQSSQPNRSGRNGNRNSHQSGRSGSRNSHHSGRSGNLGRSSILKKQQRHKGQRGRSVSFGSIRSRAKGPGSVSPHSNRSSQSTPKNPKWCTFYLKGYCKYGSRTCRYTHPGVCARWKAGKCSQSCPQNLLHQDLPKQHDRAAVAQFQAEHAKNVAYAKKNQRTNTKKSLSRSTSRASSTSTKSWEKAMGITKKKKKTKQDGSNKKKTAGHRPKQSPQ